MSKTQNPTRGETSEETSNVINATAITHPPPETQLNRKKRMIL